jgi:uncharacterized protein YidB (DUF937 family)
MVYSIKRFFPFHEEAAMGILDEVVGKAKEAVGGSGGEQSALIDSLLGMLSGGGQGGGLQGLIQSFKDKGLGDIVSSWVGTGQNLPIDKDQLQSGMGSDLIGRLASKVGMPADVAAAKLTDLLPTVVDKLTPEGKVPEPGLLEQGLNFLRSNLPKG